MTIRHQFVASITQVSTEQWNALNHDNNPFLKHQFLSALETHHCVSKQAGWIPQHLLIWQDDYLLAAMPCYLKFNSYGEFVFDWSWANYYEQNGQHYYPKLLCAVPFSPVTGSRLLLASQDQYQFNPDDIFYYAGQCIKAYVEHHQLSSAHILFSTKNEAKQFARQQFMQRVDCQFHWKNQSYLDFDHYLSTFTSKKRRNIKQERRKVNDQNFTFEHRTGDEINTEEWTKIHQLYASTFARLGGHASLSLPFFIEISQTMADNILLILVKKDADIIAAAICLKNEHTLYGRHWGAEQHYDKLHFETCYYQGLEYCIQHELGTFEPGAQGEHKISRGFAPVITHSSHWLADENFRQVIANFLDHETAALDEYAEQLQERLPFK